MGGSGDVGLTPRRPTSRRSCPARRGPCGGARVPRDPRSEAVRRLVQLLTATTDEFPDPSAAGDRRARRPSASTRSDTPAPFAARFTCRRRPRISGSRTDLRRFGRASSEGAGHPELDGSGPPLLLLPEGRPRGTAAQDRRSRRDLVCRRRLLWEEGAGGRLYGAVAGYGFTGYDRHCRLKRHRRGAVGQSRRVCPRGTDRQSRAPGKGVINVLATAGRQRYWRVLEGPRRDVLLCAMYQKFQYHGGNRCGVGVPPSVACDVCAPSPSRGGRLQCAWGRSPQLGWRRTGHFADAGGRGWL